MSQFTKIMQVFLFTLLVGLSPLQGAMAGFVETFDQAEKIFPMVDSSDRSMISSFADVVSPNCNQCNDADTWFIHDYSSGQCATCALVLPPVASQLQEPTATPALHRADEGIIKQFFIPLFRPPKI